MKQLLDQATRRMKDRTITYTWAGEPNERGESAALDLMMYHDKDRKRFVASFQAYSLSYDGVFTVKKYGIFDGSGMTITHNPCARYSAAQLDNFATLVIANLPQWAEQNEKIAKFYDMARASCDA